jgi:histidinol-phosphate aminotransferase
VRMPFNVSSLGLVGAEAALKDRAFIRKSIQVNQAGMKAMKKFYEGVGIPFLPSQGNFYLLNSRMGFGMSGPELFEQCLRMGLILRPVANYGMPDWIRVTIGTEPQNRVARRVFEALKKLKKT